MFENSEREILVHNDHYALARITENDRAAYVELQRQISGESSLFTNPLSKDTMWKASLSDEGLYIILNEEMVLCGSVELSSHSRTPEIGISILEAFRNKGIAGNAVSLLMELTYDPLTIDYYIARIERDNSHSRHVFEKMGAELMGDDLSTLEEFDEFLHEKDLVKGKDDLAGLFAIFHSNHAVVKYKLTPQRKDKE